MSLELVSLAIAIAPFALGMALTPGPNNIMLASSAPSPGPWPPCWSPPSFRWRWSGDGPQTVGGRRH